MAKHLKELRYWTITFNEDDIRSVIDYGVTEEEEKATDAQIEVIADSLIDMFNEHFSEWVLA